MSVALFILVVAVSFIIVRIGAIAFQLTGLRWPQAKFQALSCFTGTGFTTRESELIVGHSISENTADNLRILALESDSEITLNPEGDIRLRAGDSLLCFGPLTEIRTRLLKRT